MFRSHQDFRFPLLGFFASRDINPGDEIGFDYGARFWDVKNQNGIFCACGTSSCKYNKIPKMILPLPRVRNPCHVYPMTWDMGHFFCHAMSNI